jgi:glycosyltransferase involved in cell wall biosynthesis
MNHSESQPTTTSLPSITINHAASMHLAKAEELVELAIEEHGSSTSTELNLPTGFKLSIVVPVYNEERTVRELLNRVLALPIPKEVLVVDDHSTDSTPDILQEFNACSEVKIIRQECNQGKGAALRTGFAQATGEIVAVQDADLEYDPRDLLQLIPPFLRDEAEVVYGSRFLHEVPHDKSWVHRLGNWLLTTASNSFTGLIITDMETCHKAFRRDWIRNVTLRQNRFGFEPEVTAKLARLGARFAEVPISYQARSYREGKKIGIRDLFNALWCIVRYGLAD